MCQIAVAWADTSRITGPAYAGGSKGGKQDYIRCVLSFSVAGQKPPWCRGQGAWVLGVGTGNGEVGSPFGAHS